MRDFRFRAWHKDAKEMLQSRQQGYQGNVFAWLAEGQPVEIMQYTGLKDKNGKEIYEGDIAKYFMGSIWKYGQVVWGVGGWEFHVFLFGEKRLDRVFKFPSFIPTPYPGEEQMQDQFEIIGNIYEDTELLKEKP